MDEGNQMNYEYLEEILVQVREYLEGRFGLTDEYEDCYSEWNDEYLINVLNALTSKVHNEGLKNKWKN